MTDLDKALEAEKVAYYRQVYLIHDEHIYCKCGNELITSQEIIERICRECI